MHKLLDTETVLPDGYPIFPGYIYICDMQFVQYDGLWDEKLRETTVADWKRRSGFREIRRCAIFQRSGQARLGDIVVAENDEKEK